MRTKNKITAKLIYDKDSKRYHRFLVKSEGDEITGAIYFLKKASIPERVTLQVVTQRELNARR